MGQGDRPHHSICALRLGDGWLCVLTAGIVNRQFDRMRKLLAGVMLVFILGSFRGWLIIGG